MRPPILVLHASGTNRDHDAARACALAGGDPEIVHVNQLASGERRLVDYRMLVIPGGFSYGDDLGAGRLWAVALRHRLGDQIEAFLAAKRPVLGICNGFQTLVKAGLLPALPPPGGAAEGADGAAERQLATLTRNESARFECRWVFLRPEAQERCVFTLGMDDLVPCPVAHGEGRFVARDEATLAAIEAAGLVALRYVAGPDADRDGADSDGDDRDGSGGDGAAAPYPANPNGSWNDIAGICNPDGNVLGLMPHPEDAVVPEQLPDFHRRERGVRPATGSLPGLRLFENGVRHAADL